MIEGAHWNSIQHPQLGDNRTRKTFSTNVDLETEFKKNILMTSLHMYLFQVLNCS